MVAKKPEKEKFRSLRRDKNPSFCAELLRLAMNNKNKKYNLNLK